MIIFLYSITVAAFSVYSWALVDPNITLFDSQIWVIFRERMIHLGYYQRELSSFYYIVQIFLLFILHHISIKRYKKISLNQVLIITSATLLISYPFLSHDFFNYLFDAKIITTYHQNPYFHKALDYPQDSWLRFMHWTHRTYPYGPSWLFFTLIPSFLAFGKFILNFIFFKMMIVGLYIISTLLLNKLNKRWAIIIATHPLILVEGLINAHNDMVGLSLAIIGIYFLSKKSKWSSIFFILSAGIKYITGALLIFIHRKPKHTDSLQIMRKSAFVGLVGTICIMLYLTFYSEIQPWYFLAILVFYPFFEKQLNQLSLFFAGLLFSYYPYIRFGGWADEGNVLIKHQIILFFFILNSVYLAINYYKNKTI